MVESGKIPVPSRRYGLDHNILVHHRGAHRKVQRLLDDTRRSLTRRYLMETSLKLTEIVGLVGYSELSAFSRPARRWFGTSPRNFRRQAPNLDAAA
jgi:AraC-like DNA-binding protein